MLKTKQKSLVKLPKSKCSITVIATALTPSVSKIHHNLQNTLNTLFWLVIYFDSPKQFSGAETPTSKRTSGKRRTEAGLRLRLPGSAHFHCIILSLTGYHEGGGLLLMGLQDCLSEALGNLTISGRHPPPDCRTRRLPRGVVSPADTPSGLLSYHLQRTVPASRLRCRLLLIIQASGHN